MRSIMLSSRKLLIYCIGITVIVIASCAKKSFLPDVIAPVTDTLNITASVKGRVVDENGQPVIGATVVVGRTTEQTDANGGFDFTSIKMNDYAAHIKVTKAGYFNGSRIFIARDRQSHYATIQLLKKNDMGIISSSTGGTLSLTNGASITLPANGVVYESSNATYNGEVHISLVWIDPSSSDFHTKVPGSLRGVDSNGIEKGLNNYGVFGIILTGSNGEALQVSRTKLTVLQFPIPASNQSNAPSTIALWSYNEATGFWKADGSAIKNGNYYKTAVNHLSFWSCNVAYSSVKFTVTIHDQNNYALKNSIVRVKRVISNTYLYAYTDDLGFASLKVPASEPLTLEVLSKSPCSPVLIYSRNMGNFPTGTNADGGVAVVNNLGSYGTATLRGNVYSCSGKPVTNGFVNITQGSLSYHVPITNGSYTVTVPMCSAVDTISYYAVDYTSLVSSFHYNGIIYPNKDNAISINTCEVSTKRFLNYAIDTTNIDSIKSPSDSTTGVFVSQVNPSFTYIKGFNSKGTIKFSFLGGYNTGIFQVNSLSLSGTGVNTSDTAYNTSNLAVSISEYGNVGDYIAGTITGSYIGLPSNVTHNMQSSFRVRRDY